MSYDVLTISVFERQAKKLAKKYPSLKTDLTQLVSLLSETPKTGTLIAENCYKIRMAIKSKGKGKSGGARVITFVTVLDRSVYLLAIYDKSDKANISDKELEELLSYIED